MKTILSVIHFLTCFCVYAQVNDSAKITNEVNNLIALNRAMVAKQSYDSALVFIETAQEKAVYKFGNQSLLYAKCINNMGRTLQNMNKNQEAEIYYKDAIDLYQKNNESHTAEYSSLLLNATVLNTSLSKFSKALEITEEMLPLRIKIFGKESREYFTSLNTLGTLYYKMEAYEKADSIYSIVLNFRSKNKATGGVEYRNILSSMGNTQFHLGNNDQAFKYYTEALEYAESVGGKHTREWYGTLNNIAYIYQATGDYKKAEEIYLEVLDSKRISDPLAYTTAGNLAELYRLSGQYTKAEEMIQKSLHSIVKKGNIDSLLFASMLSTLAAIQVTTERYKQAEQNYLFFKDIYFRLLGKSERYVNALNSLGDFYNRIGSFTKAQKLFDEAQSIIDTKPQFNAQLSSMILTNHSITLYGLLNFSEAKIKLTEAILHLSLQNGRNTSGYITSLIRLGALHSDLNNGDSALVIYNMALDALKISFPNNAARKLDIQNAIVTNFLNYRRYSDAYEYLISIKNNNDSLAAEHTKFNLSFNTHLIYVLNKMGLKDSLIDYHRLFNQMHQELTLAKTYLSEPEQKEFQKKYALFFNSSINSILNQNRVDQKVLKLCLNSLLLQKSYLLENQIELRKMTISDSTALEKYSSWTEIKSNLYKSYMTYDEKNEKHISLLEEKANLLEKSISRYLPEGFVKLDTVAQKLQRILKAEEVILEFVEYIDQGNKMADDQSAYGVFIIYPYTINANIQFIPLCNKRKLAEIASLPGSAKSEFYSNLYLSDQKTMSVYDLIWQKIESELERFSIKTIYYSPAGILHRFNLGAASKNKGISFVSDKYKMIRMLNTKSLLQKSLKVKPDEWKGILAYGGITYKDFNLAGSADTLSGPPSSTSDFRVRSDTTVFSFLPGTAKEVEVLRALSLSKKRPFKGLVSNQATERSFKIHLSNQGNLFDIIHIGTHGMFLKDESDDLNFHHINYSTKYLSNPLLHSALLFARGGDSLSRQEDGIFTAFEASSLKLENTRLVTLSACETGLGEIQGNEGVYGLQRAFLMAGAKSLVMSLWKVEDAITEKLMTLFYKNYLLKEMNVHEALAEAQKNIRNVKLKDGIYPYRNPFFWAGFVSISQ